MWDRSPDGVVNPGLGLVNPGVEEKRRFLSGEESYAGGIELMSWAFELEVLR
jgi:hypothetical protein